jgi:hypothetical protein
MRTRNNVDGNDCSDPATSRRACVNRRANRADFAAHNRRHQSRVNPLVTDEFNVGGFNHRVGGFNHRYQTHTFNHSECFHNLPVSVIAL